MSYWKQKLLRGRSRFCQSLHCRILISLGLLMLVTLLMIGASVAYSIRLAEQGAWQGRQAEAARNAGETVAHFLHHVQDSLTTVILLDRDYPTARLRMMHDLLRHEPALLEVLYLDADGKVLASAYQDVSLLANVFTIPQSNWFVEATAGQLYLGPVQMSANNEPYLVMAIPAPDGGVVAVRLRMRVLWDVVANIRFGQTGRAYVVNRDGRIVAHIRPEVVLTNMNIAGRPEMLAIVQAPGHQWNGVYLNFEDVPVVGTSFPVRGTRWMVIAELPLAEAFAASRKASVYLTGGMLIFGMLVVGTAAQVLKRTIFRPIERLRVGVERIGQGDLSYRIDGFRRDEVGQVAEAFNEMADRLREHERQLAAKTSALAVEVAERTRAEDALRRAHDELEARVQRRTAELARVNENLQVEIAERRRAEERAQRLLDQQVAINQLALALGESGDLNEIYRLVHDFVRALLNAEAFIVTPYDSDIQPAAVEHPGAEEDTAGVEASSIEGQAESTFYVPMRAEGEIVGTMQVQIRQPDTCSQEDLELLPGLANVAAVAIQNVRLLERTRKEAQRVETIIGTVPEGVLLLDADHRILLANPVAATYLATLAGTGVGDILTRLGRRPLAKLLTSPPKGLWHEVTIDRPSAQTFEVVAQPIEIGPMPGGWVLVIRDVTEEQQIERHVQQQERLAAVGQLAAGIAHDFNNIMAVIVLQCQIALSLSDLPPKVHDRLSIIGQQARHAANLIQQNLDFSRRSVLERCSLELVPFFKEMVKLLERTLPEDIKVDLFYDPDEYTVNGDPTRLQQAIMNLAVNARDAMPEGGALHFRLERTWVEHGRKIPVPGMAAGEWIKISVTDSGAGISPDILSRIFEPFFTTKAPGQGTGLGLAQVHGIVKQHEGEIDVSSQTGQGTTFTIYLPALPVHQQELLSQGTQSLIQGRGETVLIVEDNPATRDTLVDSLTALNYRTVALTNGQEALAHLTQNGGEVALILSDVVMPEMGGIALFRALKEKNLTMPVVLLTGHPLHEKLEQLRAEGLADWLLKPPELRELSQRLAKALQHSYNQ